MEAYILKKCPNLIEETHFGEAFFKCGVTNNALETDFCESLCLKSNFDDCDHILDPNKLQFKGKWKEIVGLDHIKMKLIEDIQIPFLFPEKKVTALPVIILFGPDGCGKSKLVQILAEESKAKLIQLNPRNVESISSQIAECVDPTIFMVEEIDIVAPAAEQRDIFTSVFGGSGTGHPHSYCHELAPVPTSDILLFTVKTFSYALALSENPALVVDDFAYST